MDRNRPHACVLGRARALGHAFACMGHASLGHVCMSALWTMCQFGPLSTWAYVHVYGPGPTCLRAPFSTLGLPACLQVLHSGSSMGFMGQMGFFQAKQRCQTQHNYPLNYLLHVLVFIPFQDNKYLYQTIIYSKKWFYGCNLLDSAINFFTIFWIVCYSHYHVKFGKLYTVFSTEFHKLLVQLPSLGGVHAIKNLATYLLFSAHYDKFGMAIF